MSKATHANTGARRRRFHRRTAPGDAPGTIAVDPLAQQSRVVVTSYGKDDVEQIANATIADAWRLRGTRSVLWVSVSGLGDAALINELGKLFRLHPLALEDVVNVHQQVKVEDYDDHLFVVGRAAVDAQGQTEQISMFFGKDYVVTFQERHEDRLAALYQRLAQATSPLRLRGADFLAYRVLDTIVDGYFPILEQQGEILDGIEELIDGDPPRRIVQDLHGIRSALRTLRRVIWSHREALSTLVRDPNPLVQDETKTYLRDCLDHTVQLVELVETYRETSADVRDAYLSAVNYRLSEIMTVLTVIATIFIPLGFIASVYGMNFNTAVSPWNMPELGWSFGYPFALGLMALVAAGLLGYFYARGWLWRGGGD